LAQLHIPNPIIQDATAFCVSILLANIVILVVDRMWTTWQTRHRHTVGWLAD
jgi:hypothetical protein